MKRTLRSEFLLLCLPVLLLLVVAILFTPLTKNQPLGFSHTELVTIPPVRGNSYHPKEPDTRINVYIKYTPVTFYEQWKSRWLGVVLPASFTLENAAGGPAFKTHSGIHGGPDHIVVNRHSYYRFHSRGQHIYVTQLFASLKKIPLSVGNITLNGTCKSQQRWYQTKVLVRQNGVYKGLVKLPLTAIYRDN